MGIIQECDRCKRHSPEIIKSGGKLYTANKWFAVLITPRSATDKSINLLLCEVCHAGMLDYIRKGKS